MNLDKPIYIVDIIGNAVCTAKSRIISDGKTLLQVIQANEMALFGSTSISTIDYQYGHFAELLETLFQMTKSPEEMLKKYPLVYLVQDFSEDRGIGGYYAATNLNIIIAHQTLNTYKITDRMRFVFKPVLYPIYYTLLKSFADYPGILEGDDDSISHTKIDRSYWGSNPAAGNKNALTDYLDAIEITNLSLKFNYNNC